MEENKEKQDEQRPNTQWDPGFCASMELEFWQNWGDLKFEPEHQVGKKPLRIDLLIIRNDKKAVIRNAIGHIFEKYNVVEYKSPNDSMNIDTFYKTNAYACLYKISAGNVNRYKAADITITLVRYEYPREMIYCLQEEGYVVENILPGIYYITGQVMFRTQLIVSRELSENEHIWLTALTNNITQECYEAFANKAAAMKQKREKECAEAVFEVVTSANRKAIEDWKEESNMMTQTLREIFAPEIEELRRQAVEAGERIGEARGEKIGEARGEKIGEARGEKIGQARGEKIGQARGEKIGEARGQTIGLIIGAKMNLISLICRKLKKGKEPEVIAEELDEDLETVQNICEVAGKFAPEYDVQAIYEAMQD